MSPTSCDRTVLRVKPGLKRQGTEQDAGRDTERVDETGVASKPFQPSTGNWATKNNSKCRKISDPKGFLGGPSVGKGNRKAQGIGVSAQELLLCNTPRCSRNRFHIQQTNSAVTSATAARAHPSHICSTTRQRGTEGEGQLSPGRAPAAPGTPRVERTELCDAARHSTSLVFTFISSGSFLHSKAQLTCRHLPWSAALLIQGERGD